MTDPVVFNIYIAAAIVFSLVYTVYIVHLIIDDASIIDLFWGAGFGLVAAGSAQDQDDEECSEDRGSVHGSAASMQVKIRWRLDSELLDKTKFPASNKYHLDLWVEVQSTDAG